MILICGEFSWIGDDSDAEVYEDDGLDDLASSHLFDGDCICPECGSVASPA